MAGSKWDEMALQGLADLEATYRTHPARAVRELDRLGLLDDQGRLLTGRARAARLKALGLAAGRVPPLVSFEPTPQAR